ncbi:hypothetical protein TNCV_2587861 [Trichonephila clavipes]|nr:hypothetical protein TNCV_2587861 [Trichonephila clavipes]
MQVTVRFCSVPAHNLEGENSGVARGLPPTSREDVRLDGCLQTFMSSSGLEPSPYGTAKLLGAVDMRRYPRAENRVWSDQEDHEERGSKDHAASTCGPHSDFFNDMSRRRRSNCSTNNLQTPYRSKS